MLSLSKTSSSVTPLLLRAANKGDLVTLRRVVTRKGAGVLSTVTAPDGALPIHICAKNGFIECVDFMLGQDGMSMDVRDRDAKRAGNLLHYAAWGGHLALVRFLLERGADAGALDVVGNTPLLYAVYGGSRACVEEFVRRGRSLRERNNKNHSAILQASCGGHLDLVKWLIDTQRHSLADRDTDGNTALLFSAWGGHRHLLEFLLERGEDINQQNANGHNIFLSAANGGRVAVVEWLLQMGFDIECTNHNSDSALLLACYGGHVQLVKRLLELGAKPTRNACGFTPLLSAANGSQLEMCRYLLDNGSSIEEKDNDDYNSIILAACSGSIDLVKFFLDRGASAQSRNSNGDGALLLSAYCGHAPLVAWLLDNGYSSLDESNNTRMGVLISAANGGSLEVIQLLLDRMRGLDLEATDEGGYSSFLLACQRGHFSCVQLLAAYGSNLHAQTTRHRNNAIALAIDFPEVQAYLHHIWDMTPLEIAIDARMVDRVHVLIAAGASLEAKHLAQATNTGPYPGAKEPNAELTALLQAAVRPWSPARHPLFGPNFTQAITSCLGVRSSLERQAVLPMLPPEIWFHILGFMQRSWFPEANPVGDMWVSPFTSQQRDAWRMGRIMRQAIEAPLLLPDEAEDDLFEEVDAEAELSCSRIHNKTSERALASDDQSVLNGEDIDVETLGDVAKAKMASFRVTWV